MRAPLAWFVFSFAACGGSSPSAELVEQDWATHCMACHGREGQGVPALPTGHRIDDKGEFWTEASLLRYLQDPQGFSKTDPRLAGRMTAPSSTLDAARLRALARYSLELMATQQ